MPVAIFDGSNFFIFCSLVKFEVEKRVRTSFCVSVFVLFFVFVPHLVFLDSLEAWRWLQDGNLDGVVNRKGREKGGVGEWEEK